MLENPYCTQKPLRLGWGLAEEKVWKVLCVCCMKRANIKRTTPVGVYMITTSLTEFEILRLSYSNPHHLIEPVFIGKELNVGKSFAKCKSV